MCIIGAGPSGLFSAIQLAPNANVILLEKNSKAGMKLRISGLGQANLTHSGTEEDFIKHYGEHGLFLKHSLYDFNNQALCDFFMQSGYLLVEREDGKFFPQARNADLIADKLVEMCLDRGVKIRFQEPVLSVSKYGSEFTVITPTQTTKCDVLILATGGITYPRTGSTGDGYRLAEAMGHHIAKPKPALAPFTIRNYAWAHLSGISYENIKVDILRHGKCVASLSDSVLFTHTGLSGPAILHLSRYAQPKDSVRLHLLDDKQFEQLSKTLRFVSSSKKSIKTILHEFGLVFRMIEMILPMCRISEAETPSQLSREKRDSLLHLLSHFELEIEDAGNVNNGMVTAGGVDLSEVNSKTMESRIVPNLYMIGEVLDVDGDSGGYNLQAAFSSAFTAAKGIKSRAGLRSC